MLELDIRCISDALLNISLPKSLIFRGKKPLGFAFQFPLRLASTRNCGTLGATDVLLLTNLVVTGIH